MMAIKHPLLHVRCLYDSVLIHAALQYSTDTIIVCLRALEISDCHKTLYIKLYLQQGLLISKYVCFTRTTCTASTTDTSYSIYSSTLNRLDQQQFHGHRYLSRLSANTV